VESGARNRRPRASVIGGIVGLDSRTDWAGFSGRSVRSTHNRLSIAEADAYESDVAETVRRYPLVHSPGPRVRHGSPALPPVGGFDCALGRFAEWELAARLHRHGVPLGYVPDALVHHHYAGDLAAWRAFTEDFVDGQMRLLDRRDGDPGAELVPEVPVDTVRHDLLVEKVARRVHDAEILHLLKLMLKASGKRGVPQGGVVQYQDLQARLDHGDVIILDGAIGTQLQAMGAPMNVTDRAAAGLHTHPYTVRHMHANYIKAGVDIITTNTYASARHNLEPMGLGDLTTELNIRAVVLAQEARDRVRFRWRASDSRHLQ